LRQRALELIKRAADAKGSFTIVSIDEAFDQYGVMRLW